MNAMNKLDADSIHIMESDDDEQIVFERQNRKETRQRRDIPQEKPKDKAHLGNLGGLCLVRFPLVRFDQNSGRPF